MAYITEKKLGSVIDIPICLPAVELLQGDWLVVANIKLIAPMRLTYRYLTAQMITSTVDTRDVTAANKVSAGRGLAFAGFYFNYGGGAIGSVTALDTVDLASIQTVARSAAPVIQTSPGVYSLIVVNNMKPSTAAEAVIPLEVSIDFKLTITGSIRLELNPT